MKQPTPSELAEFGIDPIAEPNGRPVARVAPKAVRMLPQSPDGEKGTLCSFLISPRMVGALCVEKQITRNHFFTPAHAIIFDVLMARWDRNEPIDFIILTQVLRDAGKLEECGGAANVTDLFNLLPTSARIDHYLDILTKKHQARSVKRIATEYDMRVESEQGQMDVLLDDLERDVMAIRKVRPNSTQYESKALVVRAIGMLEEMFSRKGKVSGLPTGHRALDVLLDGLHPTEMIVLAARPGRGKSALAMNWLDHMATEQRKPVGIFSLEMSADQLMMRAVCSRARVNMRTVQQGIMTERDFPAIQLAGARLAEAKILIDDQSGLTCSDIRGRARRWKADHDIQALFIDYLQLVRSLTKRAQDSRHVEVSEASTACKELAKELGIPVIVLAQINRSIDSRGAGARPRLADLRDSGSIEADADTVIFITQPWMDTEDPDERKALMGEAELIVAKQRHGPVGDIPMTFIREYTRFEERAVVEEPEPPAKTQRNLFGK